MIYRHFALLESTLPFFKLLRRGLHTDGSHTHRTRQQDLLKCMLIELPHKPGGLEDKLINSMLWGSCQRHIFWTISWTLYFWRVWRSMWLNSHFKGSHELGRIMNSKHWRSSWTCSDFLWLQILVCITPRVSSAGWREELRISLDVLMDPWRF